jgi:RHS repeat-associated protein
VQSSALPEALEAAGGIGGLLAVEQVEVGGGTGQGGVDAGNYVFAYDGNGNVVQVLDWAAASAPAAIVAKYEYDPYGNVVASGRDYAAVNPFRFSTKYWDADVGMAYYGYRWYWPTVGRWISTDPIGNLAAGLSQQGGGPELRAFVQSKSRQSGRSLQATRDGNLYAYADNDPARRIDLLGLLPDVVCCSDAQRAQLIAAYMQARLDISKTIQNINAAIAADRGQYPAFTQLKLRKAAQYLSCADRQLTSGLRFRCDPGKGMCKGAYAWVNWIFARTLHVCPLLFDDVPSFFDRRVFQGAALVHEATHKCGANDAHYFWQCGEHPRDVGLGIFAFQDIASTYDTWILTGFCIPGYDCP